MSSARRALLFSFGENYARFIVNFVSMLILARMLSPADIGVFSIAYALAMLGHTFRELGVAHYVISETELTRDRLRAAFAVSVAMAWLMAFVIALASPYVAAFYKTPSLRDVTLLLGLNFLLVPFGALTLAMLRRQLQFGRLFVANFASALGGAIASVGFAAGGYGPMSLALGSTASVLLSVICATALRPTGLPWWPGVRELKRVLSFGSIVTVGSSMHSASVNMPDLLIGKILGLTDTGLYSKATGLIETFNRLVLLSIWNFSLAHFSAQIRDGIDPRPTYVRAVALITGLAWPFFAVLAIAARPVVQGLLGDQWQESAPVASVLCLSAAISATYSPYANLALANRGAMAYARYFIVLAALRLISVAVAAPFGLIAVASIASVASVLSSVAAVRDLRATFSITLGDVARGTIRSAIVAVVCVAAAAGVQLALGRAKWWIELPVITAAATVAWFAALFAVRHPLSDEVRLAIGWMTARLLPPRAA